jgi:LytS/YehU family sensor histidine kinase
LFNALNSIRALIYEDQDKAAHTVTQLSELFRHHLQAHLKPLSSLREEWQLANQYLAIEQIRFEQRLEVHCDLADDCLSQQLPPLTLLTLVENAIKHGISPNARGGHIQLHAAKLDGQRWQLRVSNTVGAPSREQSTRTGLQNIRRRLELQHPQQSLQLVSDKESFSITLELVYDPNPHRG